MRLIVDESRGHPSPPHERFLNCYLNVNKVVEEQLRLGVVLEAVVFAGPVAVDFCQALVEEEEAFVSSPAAVAAPGGGMIGIAEAMVINNVQEARKSVQKRQRKVGKGREGEGKNRERGRSRRERREEVDEGGTKGWVEKENK